MTQRALLIVVVWTLQAAKSKIEYTKISRHHKKSQDGLTILHRIWQMGGAWLTCKVHTRYTRLCWMAEAWPAIRKEFALSELKICATSLLDKPSRRFLKPQYVFPRQLIKMLKPWSSKPQSVGNPFQVQSHAPPTSLVNLYQTSSTLRLRLCMNWAPARLFLPSASLTAWQVQLPRLWQTPRLATEVQKRLKYTIIQTNLFLIPTL